MRRRTGRYGPVIMPCMGSSGTLPLTRPVLAAMLLMAAFGVGAAQPDYLSHERPVGKSVLETEGSLSLIHI